MFSKKVYQTKGERIKDFFGGFFADLILVSIIYWFFASLPTGSIPHIPLNFITDSWRLDILIFTILQIAAIGFLLRIRLHLALGMLSGLIALPIFLVIGFLVICSMTNCIS